MKLAYFDCFAGAGGDMIVGALLDAGLPLEALQAELAKLDLTGYEISAEKVRRGGLGGTKFSVAVRQADQPPRNLDEIRRIIDSGRLADEVAETAKAIFARLAAAEAKVHGIGVEQVHFHEVGAVDSIVDIVAAAAGVRLLGIEQVRCSPIPVGAGTVQTSHGRLPLPAPATAQLLTGAVTAERPAGAAACELTTPTAAAVLTTLSAGYGPVPAMRLEAIGYGAGSREDEALPNLLRVLIGEAAGEGEVDSAVELSANLDDCTGEVLGAAMEKLLAAGCLDAWAAPIYMKKSRPAWQLSALCEVGDVERMEKIIFAETTTLGVRRRTCSRSKLPRRHVTVQTPYGPIRVKVAGRGAAEATASPEFADAAAAAQAHGVPVKEVLAAAAQAYRKGPQR